MNVDRAAFRHTIGIIALIGGIGGLAGLYFLPIPEGNREPLLLALGLVLGWGGTVIGYEFGSSPAGRQAAAVGVRLAEVATPDTPQEVTVVNEPSEPVPTTQTRKP